MSNQSCLITGATGFVGRHLLTALEQSPEIPKSLALIRHATDWTRYDWTPALKKVELIEGSVTNPLQWQDDLRLEGLGGIFHLAAVIRHTRDNPQEMYETNVEGLLNMVRLSHARKCRLIFVSTSGTVGCFRSPNEWADEHSPYCEDEVGSWPYYVSKIRAEKKARELADRLGVELVIVRPPIFLGPGDHRLRATGTILRMLRRKLPFILKGGMHFVDIRDSVRALIRIMEIQDPKPVYHLNGTVCTLDEFFKMVAEVSGVPAPKLHLPAGLAAAVARTTQKIDALVSEWGRGRTHPLLPDPVIFEMGSRYWNMRSRYAREDLGFVSRDPYQTLTDTVHWLREHHDDLRAGEPVGDHPNSSSRAEEFRW